MGNSQSATRRIYWKLACALPEVHGHSGEGWFDSGSKPFSNDKDREQFIHAVIVTITNNGELELGNYNFRLLYSRRENDRVVARIVAEHEGVIRAKIEPDADGKDQKEAFLALRKWVEIRLDRILQDVPGDGATKEAVASSSRTTVAPTTNTRVVPTEAPPAYGMGDVKKPLK